MPALVLPMYSELQRLKLEIYANPDLELDDRVKKLRQVNYKNYYRQRCHSDRLHGPCANLLRERVLSYYRCKCRGSCRGLA
eukprot:1136473-Pelagomonas_calceolata.AAC.3